MKDKLNYYVFNIFLLYVLMSCSIETPSESAGDVETVELEEFEIIVAEEDGLLGQPYLLTYDGNTEHLFVYDHSHVKVLELDGGGEVVNEFGREGQGPGELQGARNIFLTRSHLYIVDHFRYYIHKYDRQGEVVSTKDYGEQLRQRDTAVPPPPRQPLAPDINNQPSITLDGHVLQPSGRNGQAIFELRDWQGDHLADIGKIPKGSVSVMDDDEFAEAIKNREVPAQDLSWAFPVNDKANPQEYFLIYSAIPKIAKYNIDGQKLWERDIPETLEIESITNDHFDVLDRATRGSRLPLRKYIAGTSSPEGELYLSTYTNLFTPTENRPLWIHHFNVDGELIHRYNLISDHEIYLLSFFDIDFANRRILTMTLQSAEIWSYPY
jgi:hypothetical protein